MTAIAQLRQFVRELAAPISSALGIRQLPNHADLLLMSAVVFWATQLFLGPVTGRLMLGSEKWNAWKNRERNNWNIHVVSMVHALVIIPLAWACLDLESLSKNKAFGWDDRVGHTAAIACGYFLWDTIESVVHYSDVGFVVHGLSCLLIYLFTFKPFIAYYGPRFLLWELSTPFLNIHWFMDKLNMTGSTMQLVNGVLLLTSFAGARLLYGGYMSYEFWQTLYQIRNEVPLAICLIYGVGNILLNGLNWFWFMKMIVALRKRMVPSVKNKHANANGNPVERVANDNGSRRTKSS